MIFAIFLYISYVPNEIFTCPNGIFTHLGWVDIDFFLPLQAITWANVDPELCCHMASLDHNELIDHWSAERVCGILTAILINDKSFEITKVPWDPFIRTDNEKLKNVKIASFSWSLQIIFILSLLRDHILFDTLRLRQNGRHFADEIFKRIFLNENIWIPIKISLKFVPKGQINNIPTLVQIMAWRHPGDKPLSEAMMVSLLTHIYICVTWPQWVKTNWLVFLERFYCRVKSWHTGSLHQFVTPTLTELLVFYPEWETTSHIKPPTKGYFHRNSTVVHNSCQFLLSAVTGPEWIHWTCKETPLI